MAQLQTVCGKQIIVDDEDFYKCSQISWYWSGTIVYNHNIGSLAKFILNTKDLVDHQDRNPLNFKKENLRYADKSLNGANQGLRSNNTTGRKGVYWRKNRKHWYAKIMVDGQEIYLGTFKDMYEAEKAYDRAAVKYFREFARTNQMIAAEGK
jgi:hypothetical protein